MKKFITASGVAGYSVALAGLITIAVAEPAGPAFAAGFWSALCGPAVGGLALIIRGYLE